MATEKILLAFTTQHTQQAIAEALTQDMGNKELYYFFVRHPQMSNVFNAIDEQMEETECGRCLLIHRTMRPMDIPPLRLKPNYYIINTVEQLEQALGIELEERQRRSLTNRTLRSQQQTVDAILFGNAPFILQFDFIQPQEEERPVVREPVNEIWESRLSEKKRKRDDENDEEDADEVTCIICLDEYPTVMLAPCQHQCLCEICAREVLERSDVKKQCPVCRTEIGEIYKPIL